MQNWKNKNSIMFSSKKLVGNTAGQGNQPAGSGFTNISDNVLKGEKYFCTMFREKITLIKYK